MEKIIPNTNELYTVTDDGRVFSYNKYPEGHELKAGIIGNGYKAVVIKYDDDTFKIRYVHRLVAEAFVPNLTGSNVVNHLDEDKLNNKAENLEWVTQKQNCRYSSKKGVKKGGKAGSPKRVALLDENYEIERVFFSIRDAARYIRPDNWNSAYVMINKVCSKNCPHHVSACGRKWVFIDNVTFLNYINEHPDWINEKALKHSGIIVRDMLEKTMIKYNPKTNKYEQIKEIVRIKKEDGSMTVQLF